MNHPSWCWDTTVLSREQYDRSNGPYWLRQRNYLVTALLAAPLNDHARELLHAAQPSGGQKLVEVFAAECLWGALSLELLGPVEPREVQSAAELVLSRAPWLQVLRSGWPLFRLLELLVPEAANGTLSVTSSGGQQRILDAVASLSRAAYRSSAANPPDGSLRPGAALGAVDEIASLVIPRLQNLARMFRPGLALDSRLWAELGRLQEVLYLRGSCPPGSFVASVRSAAVEYHLCIRQPESVHGYFGASLVDRRIMNHGVWPDCKEAIHHLARQPRCIVLEVGANIGSCTLLWARLGIRVVAVEAEPSNLSLLRASLQLPQPGAIQMANVSVADIAADEASGTVSISRDPANAGESTIVPRAAPDTKSSSAAAAPSESARWTSVVPASTLDDIAAEHVLHLGGKLSDVCFIKIDVEAAELRVLRGSRSLLASRSLRAVNFEFVPIGRDGGRGLGVKAAREILELLAASGLRIRGHRPVLQERDYAPAEFDGLVARLAAVGKLGTTLTAYRAR